MPRHSSTRAHQLLWLLAAISCSDAEREHTLEDGGVDAATDAAMDAPWQVIVTDALLFSTQPLSLPDPSAYFALYVRRPGAEMGELVSDVGDPCRDARKPAECFAKLDELVASAECTSAAKCRAFTVLQQGDRVELQRSPDEFVQRFGEVDSHIEAIITAMFHGLYAGRPTMTMVQEVADGYRVRSVWESCEGSRGEQVLDVARDGSTGGFTINMIYESRCLAALSAAPPLASLAKSHAAESSAL